MLVCGDSEQLAVAGTSVGFTATKLKPTSGDFTGQKCQRVLFQAHDDACYANFDGTDATAAKGVEMTNLDILVEEGFANISNLRFIRKTGNMVIRAWFWYNVTGAPMLICGDGEILAVGANIVNNPNFTTTPDTNWIWGADWTHHVDHADHTTGILALEQDVGVIPGPYLVTFTMTRSAGSLVPWIGGVAGTSRATSNTFAETITANTTGNLRFVPSTDFAGSVDTVVVERLSHAFTTTKLKPITGNFTGRKCIKVLFQPLTDTVYVSFDGSIASTTAGIELAAGDILIETGFKNISNIRFIRKTNAASVRAWFWYQV